MKIIASILLSSIAAIIGAIMFWQATSVSSFDGTIFFQSDRDDGHPGVFFLKNKRLDYVCSGRMPAIMLDSKSMLFVNEMDDLCLKLADKTIADKISMGDIKLSMFACPKISASQNKVAFIGMHGSIGDIYVHDLLNNELTNLTDYVNSRKDIKDISLFSPSWFPDSRRIAFRDWGRSGIIIKDLDGGNEEVFARNIDIHIEDISVSPDGNTIAFTGVNMDGKRNGKTSELFLISLSSRKIVQLTNNDCAERYPAWSPDGKEICFTSFRHGGPLVGGELYILTLATKKERRITKATRITGQQPFGGWTTDIYPCWVK